MTPLPLWNPIAYRKPTFVLDASVPLEWWFGPPVGYANDVIMRIPSTAVTVTGCWSMQLVEALLRYSRSGRIATTDITRYLSYLETFQVVVDTRTPYVAWSDVLTLAQAHSLSVYDAACLELSLRLKLPLATIDATLSHAAAAAGVSIFTP